MPHTKNNILLLCAEAARHTGTVDLHIQAFKQYSRHNVVILDSFVAAQLDFDMEMFDVIVFHYSIVISLPHYLPQKLARKISDFDGPKVLFIQDEFRWVDRTSQAARRLGISVIFTVVNVNEDVIRKIYRDSYFDHVRFEQTLTGFVPENLIAKEVPDYRDRPFDIGYRARKLPGWCGSFALQKWKIGERVLQDAPSYGLKCDIAMSEASRIYGEDWITFMGNCKATLGTESGASFVDHSGLVHQEIDRYEAKNPRASFEEVKDRFLEGRDGEVVIHVISPRVFEAAALRTLMILYPGTYSGILRSGRHYVELAPDHSNMDEVVAVLRDPDRAGEIVNNAYDEIARSPAWTHESFVEKFDGVIDGELEKHTTKARATGEAIERVISARSDQIKLEMQNLEAGKLAEFKRLEEANLRGAQKSQKRMRIVLFLQKIRVCLYDFVDKRLPPIISGKLLGVGSRLSKLLKPVVKKILFRN